MNRSNGWRSMVVSFSVIALSLGVDVSAKNEIPFEAFLGNWEGRARTDAESVTVNLEINAVDGELEAFLSLSEMGVLKWPASRCKIEKARMELQFPADSSKQTFELRLEAGQVLKGVWRDSRFSDSAQLVLTRTEATILAKGSSVSLQGTAGNLSAEMFIPDGRGPFPGVVFVHGSGPQPKDASRYSAVALARQGVASAIYDKRGAGYSDGQWKTATFDDLSGDAIAVAERLLAEERVGAVGFSGQSQGGWVAPLAASKWDHSAFVISIAGPAVSPAREAHWEYVDRVRKWGGDQRTEEDVRRLVDLFHVGLRSGDQSRYHQAIAASRVRSWFSASGLEHLNFPHDRDWLTGYLATMDHDPVPVLKSLQIPFLSILSPDDESVDSEETSKILRRLRSNGLNLKLIQYPGYNHGMRRIGDGLRSRWPGHPESYFETQANFIKEAVRF